MKYSYESLDVVIGCVPGGFGKECDNCCALWTSRKLSGSSGIVHKLHKKATTRKNNKVCWTGKVLENSYCYNKITGIRKGKIPAKKNFLVSYSGEIALANPRVFVRLFEEIITHPYHDFTILTKLPIKLGENMKPAFAFTNAIGIDILKLSNLKIATSVGSDEFKYRINDLVKTFKGFHLEVWHKPLLSPIVRPDYTGITSIRWNAEKGKKPRTFCKEWVEDIKQAAIKQNVQVYCDMEDK